MRILIVNDDGIEAEGILRLAKMAQEFSDDIWVIAPARQCSAMSQAINLRGEILVKPYDFPLKGVHAYSIDSTPTDCVRIAYEYLLDQKPDFVFSGINFGYNTGYDIVYSATVAAAREAVLRGTPAIAFSHEANAPLAVTEKYLLEVAKQVMPKAEEERSVWNVNFPGCTLAEFKGILWNRTMAKVQMYKDGFLAKKNEDGSETLMVNGTLVKEAPEGTDMNAVFNNYISIGTV